MSLVRECFPPERRAAPALWREREKEEDRKKEKVKEGGRGSIAKERDRDTHHGINMKGLASSLTLSFVLFVAAA